jgi:phosphoglycerol transferase
MKKSRLISGIWCGAACLISLLAALLSFDVSLQDLDIPVIYQMDGYQYMISIKAFVNSGDPLWNPSLGAPTGVTEIEQFPLNALWNYLCAGLLAKLTGSTGMAVNLYYFLGYPLAVASSFVVMKKMRLSDLASFVGSLAFSLLSFHFYHAAHFTLQAYYLIPLGLYLCCRLLRRESQSWNDKFAATVLILGLTSTYYSLFFSFLFVASGLLGALAWRKARHLLNATGYTALILFAVLLGTNQAVLSWIYQGRSTDAHKRYSHEAEMYGLRLGQLVLPALGHNSDRAVKFKGSYMDGKQIYENEHAWLGLLGVLGLLASGVWLLSPRPRRDDPDDFHRLAILNLICFLFGTIGGLGSITAVFFPSLRCLTRLSVFVAFISLCWAAKLLDSALNKIPHGEKLALQVPLSLVLAAFVIWDQIPIRHIHSRATTVERFLSDQTFVSGMEESLPPGAAIFQWPYDSYPENSLGSRLILHSEHLRWSVGGIPGSEQDAWYRKTCQLPLGSMVRELKRKNFQRICVDQKLATRTMSEAELLHFKDNLERYARKVRSSELGDVELYEITRLPVPIARVSLNLLPHKPYPVEILSGFSLLEQTNGQGFVWSDGPHSVLSFPRLSSQPHELSMRVAALNMLDDIELTISVNGKTLATQTVGPEPKLILVSVPTDLLSKSNRVKIGYSKTLKSSSGRGELEDGRDLAVMFTRIQWSAARRPEEG